MTPHINESKGMVPGTNSRYNETRHQRDPRTAGPMLSETGTEGEMEKSHWDT